MTLNRSTVYTVISFGPREWLRYRGYTTAGDLEFRQRRVSVAEIQARVASHFMIPLAEMKSARRSAVVVRPRQIAMYLSKRFTSQSLPEIGRRFGNRDHTTVIHAIRRIEALRTTDGDLAGSVDMLVQGFQS